MMCFFFFFANTKMEKKIKKWITFNKPYKSGWRTLAHGPPPVFENKVLLALSHVLSFICCFHASVAELSSYDRDRLAHKLKYICYLALPRKSASSWLRKTKSGFLTV